jgi:hypothetical protein
MEKIFEYKLAEQNENGEPNAFSGKVKLKICSFVERNELMKKINFKVDQAEAKLADNLDAGSRLAEVVKDYLVEMKVKKGEKEFISLDEIDYDQDVGLFYAEVGLVLCKGIDLGKS